MFGKVKAFFSEVVNEAKRDVYNFLDKHKKTLSCLAFIGVIIAASSASAEVTLPATGVDIGEYITAGITALGGVVAVAIGGYIAFLLVGRGLGWARKAFSGK